jgi:hypothetical protein
MDYNLNILDKANQIINNRSEEADRQYGPINEGIQKTAQMASIMSNKNITAIDVYNVLIALKFSRQAVSHKTDNLLDAVAYIGGLNSLHNEEHDKACSGCDKCGNIKININDYEDTGKQLKLKD